MTTLAVFAHFDPGGLVAPHVDRYLARLAGAVDRVVVVSSAPLTADAARTLERHGDLVRRDNVGYDFASWKAGLDHVGDWDGFDRVVICNDSVVGPVRPMTEILGGRAPRDVDFWGMTASSEISPHVQSWFVVFERAVIGSGLLHGFWRAMQPESRRYQVIRRYEVGMSRLLLTAGLRMGRYLRPTARDTVRAELRQRAVARADRRAAELVTPGPVLLAPRRTPRWNPTYVLWDAVFDGRLPFVKLEVLRDDPYRVGREQMLARLEQAFPEEFDGVRDHLQRTGADMRRLRGLTPS